MAALSKASAMAAVFMEDFPNTTKLLFFSDNTSAVQAITSPKPSSAQTFALSFIKNLNSLLDSHPLLSISIAWCPSHCDIPGNERADTLAKEATSLRCQIPFTTSRSNARRRSKTTTTKLWLNDWKVSNNSGRFAISNRLKPSLKPTKHFLMLKDNREVFGRVLQCRTGHAYLGEFRRDFLPNSPDPRTCPCDNLTPESRAHVIQECPRYTQHRDILENASKHLFLPTILGSKKGISALAEFIQKSSAFSRTGTPLANPLPPAPEDEPIPNMDPETNPTLVYDDGG